MSGYRGKHRKPEINPEWWERAISGTCSHGGHGYDGETCDEGPAGFCDDDDSKE